MPAEKWKLIIYYLSTTKLSQQMEHLLKKIKPTTVKQWDSLIKRFEKADTVKILTLPNTLTEDYMLKSKAHNGSANSNLSQTSIIPKAKRDTNAIANDNVTKEDVNSESLMPGNDESDEMTIEVMFQGLKLKKDLHYGKLSEPSWKTNKPIISKVSIHSRTAYIISAIVNAETNLCLLKRIEHFIQHLKNYPEARDYAIREGGVRTLLRVQNQLHYGGSIDMDIKAAINEGLALLGFIGPSKGPGPNVLSIDGGGIRGLIAIEILKHLEKLTGKKVQHLFDYIIGVSTGAIIAAVIGSGAGNLQMASDMYLNLSKKMFGNTSLIGGTSRLVWSHSYYDTDAWEKMLQDNVGEMTLTNCNRRSTPKIALVSCVVNSGSRLSPFLFRTYEMPFRVRSVFPGTSSAMVWEAVRASAAAPTYFQEFKHNGLLHQDGGIMVNNPMGVGLHEVRLLYGPAALQNACLISVGTGKALTKHTDYHGYTNNVATKDSTASNTSWKEKFNKILDSATDTEGVHLILNDILPSGNYFRLNPPLMEQCAMDEISSDKLNKVIFDTQSYIRRNKSKFQNAAAMLVRKRSIKQKVEDFVEHQMQIMGVKQNK